MIKKFQTYVALFDEQSNLLNRLTINSAVDLLAVSGVPRSNAMTVLRRMARYKYIVLTANFVEVF